MSRKILYSPGFGAGWSTWMDSKVRKFACTYQPIIDVLEKGEKLQLKGGTFNEPNYHPVIQQFLNDVKEKFGIGYVCVLGAGDLAIYECGDDEVVRIEEYDGYESVVTGYNDWV